MWWIVPLILGIIIFVIALYRVRQRPDPYHVVVARYMEDISWTDKYAPYVKVYEKGPGGTLPNIGRESHTYIHYIVENYHKLPGVVFFTQGRIDDHPHIHGIDFLNISGLYSKNTYNLESNYYFYSSDGGYDKDHLLEYDGRRPTPRDELGFRRWFKEYVDVDNTHDIESHVDLWWGAIFSVKRELILSRPKEYYKRLLEYFPRDANDPEVGHFFERSWFYIFNCHLKKNQVEQQNAIRDGI